jgi:signal transduction histidine kinase
MPGSIRISVRDSGNGLYPEQVAQLFQSFNRLGQEVNGVEGTGIGLVVSKRLVELMGGKIGVESKIGVGSVFWFELDSIKAPVISEAGITTATLTYPHVDHHTRTHTLL